MKLRKELWFGLSIMALILIPTLIFTPWGNLTNGHLGLLEGRRVAVVGTRNATATGREAATRLGADLAAAVKSIVS